MAQAWPLATWVTVGLGAVVVGLHLARHRIGASGARAAVGLWALAWNILSTLSVINSTE